MLANVHCVSCGAAFGADAKERCAFCGAERARVEPEVRHVFAPNAEERWNSAERHPSMKELLAREPTEQEDGAFADGGLAPWILVGVGMSSLVLGAVLAGAGRDARFLLVVGSALVVFAFARVAYRRRLARSPWERALVLVVDKRRHTSDDGSETKRFVVARSRAGATNEWRCIDYLHQRLQAGDLGVAYVKRDRLVDFRKLPV